MTAVMFLAPFRGAVHSPPEEYHSTVPAVCLAFFLALLPFE